MTGTIILVASAVALWLLAFMSKRRFGMLGLALAAGALLSQSWSSELVGLLERTDLALASISTAGVAAIALVLLPSIVLFVSGPAYQRKQSRIIGATLYAVFAAALLVEPLSSVLALDAVGRDIFDIIVQYQIYIITACVAIAVLDVFVTQAGSSHHHKKAKH